MKVRSKVELEPIRPIVAAEAQQKLVTLLNSIYSFHESSPNLLSIRSALEDPKHGVHYINWVLIDNKIFDLTTLNHPGGNFIIKAVKGKRS